MTVCALFRKYVESLCCLVVAVGRRMELPEPEDMSGVVLLAQVPPDVVRDGEVLVPSWSERMVGSPYPYGLGLEGVVDGVRCVQPSVFVPRRLPHMSDRVRAGCWFVEQPSVGHCALWVGHRAPQVSVGGGVAEANNEEVLGFRLWLGRGLADEAVTVLPPNTRVSLPDPLTVCERLLLGPPRPPPTAYDAIMEIWSFPNGYEEEIPVPAGVQWRGTDHRSTGSHVASVVLCVRSRAWLRQHGVFDDALASLLSVSRQVVDSASYRAMARSGRSVSYLAIDINVRVLVVEGGEEVAADVDVE